MIAGYFDPARDTPWPIVPTAVSVDAMSRRPATVKFVLDTGAMRTCLHPIDARALGFTPAQLAAPGLSARTIPLSGVGGGFDYFVVEARLGLLHRDEGRWRIIDTQLLIAPLRPETQSLPSLLGWDVLQYFRIDLDWAERRVALHERLGPGPDS